MQSFTVTGDYRLKEKAIYLADEWMKCIDIYEYLHYNSVLTYVSKLTDYAIANFKTDINRDGLQDIELFSNNMIEWYTLPENLYRDYEFTKEDKYLDFAKEWDYDYFWDN